MTVLGFKEARQKAIAALYAGTVQHEARNDIDDKNLLVTGQVTVEQVIDLLKVCRGTQHQCSPHHHVPTIDVHVFRPIAGTPRKSWYIKLYFLEPDMWFISVHES